ncbi:MAG: hypothetical protein FJ245_15060 [Nitrospira sp.]|nr:hypothetical protein [Nitrospira sp.]
MERNGTAYLYDSDTYDMHSRHSERTRLISPDPSVAISHGPTTKRGALLLWACVLVGCASSGDVKQLRLEREQAKAAMSAELGQERKLLTDIERDSEAQRASTEKLASALAGSTGSQPLPPVFSACQAPNLSAVSVEFWISPNGHDAAPGTRKEPFKTLERAREAVARVDAKQ